MIPEKKAKCYFCLSECPQFNNSDKFDGYWMRCPICGEYAITYTLTELIEREKQRDQPGILNVIEENIRLSPGNLRPYWTAKGTPVPDGVTRAIARSLEEYLHFPIYHAEKPNEILRLIGRKLLNADPFGRVVLKRIDMYSLKIGSPTELRIWLKELMPELVSSDNDKVMDGPETAPLMLTPAGWKMVEELDKGARSNRAFIAMSFFKEKPERRAEIQTAIEAACHERGWDAKPVDGRHFTGSINDRIIADINQAYFMIADFTGNNAGVYYEAGYAEGRGMKVLYTVHKDDLPNLHFDTRHMRHIVWETPAELRQQLSDLIGAVINV